jgi:hypothetical protein
VGLRFLGGGIFGVLGKIAMGARFLDGQNDARALDLLAVLQLRLQSR